MKILRGYTIKRLRTGRNLTQKELAERVGITERTLAEWERDGSYPSSRHLPALAKALGVNMERLFK